MQATGEIQEAVALMRDAGDCDAAAQVILSQAPTLLRQGRWRTLLEVIASLPAAYTQNSPWLSYWLGVSQLMINPMESRIPLQSAFAIFSTCDDVLGQSLTAAAMIDSYCFEWSTFQPLDRWIEVLEPLLPGNPGEIAMEIEAQILASFLIAVIYRRPGDECVPRISQRLGALLPAMGDPSLKLRIATLLLHTHLHFGQQDDVDPVVALISPLINSNEIAPLLKIWWYLTLTECHFLFGNREYSAESLERAEQLIVEHGLGFLMPAISLLRIQGSLKTGDLEAVNASMAGLEPIVDHLRPNDLAFFWYLKAWQSLLQDEPAIAVQRARRSIGYAVATGQAIGLMCSRCLLAAALIRMGDVDGARAEIDAITPQLTGVTEGVLLFHVSSFKAYFEFNHGDVSMGRETLKAAFVTGAQGSFTNNLLWLPTMMAELCAAALQYGIEPGFTKILIRKTGLPAARGADDDWPWPIKIYTLGRFEVLRDDVKLEFGRKAPKRVLALLKVIVCCGGTDVPEQVLLDALWPDEDGDAASNALSTAVRRLRLLLGDPEVIQQQAGRLSIRRDRCWVDVWAFERLCAQASVPAGAKEGGSAAIEPALEMYKGQFLPEEDITAGWAVALRERLRTKFLRFLEERAKRLEDAGDYQGALTYYSRGLESDNLLEGFYQGMMRCYGRLDRRAEAINVYRRLKQVLGVTLGIAPSLATERLYESLCS